MKNLTLAALGSLSLAFAGPTLAQSFTYDVTWEPVDSVGGMIGPDGPQGGGGVVEGTYTTAYSDGTTSSGTVKCVGLQQPDGGIFDIHMSCSINDVNGKSSSVYGCNYLGEAGPDTALGCVGGLQGKDGAVAGRNGSLTMHWYSDTKSTGTGQWYAAE
jgi:hypothetical protein